MFKFGDLVRVKYGTSPINNFNGEAIFRGQSDLSCFYLLERLDGVFGGADNGRWYFRKEDEDMLELVEAAEELKEITREKNMSLKSIVKNLFRSEPEKSFIKAGVMNESLELTTEGKDLFIDFLFEKNKDLFNTEIVQKIIAEQEEK